jgi:GH18 family chitinase
MDRCAWTLGALFFVWSSAGCAGPGYSVCDAPGACDDQGAAGDTPSSDSTGSSAGAGTTGTTGTAGGHSSTTGGAMGGSPGSGGSSGAAGSGGSSVALVDAGKPFASRVVAYLPAYRGLDAWASQLDYSKITHVDLAFANPTTGNDPTLGPDSDSAVARIVDGAHAKGVRVLISIGGASGGSEKIAALLAPASVQAFAQKLDAFIDAHNLDGLDVDVEGDPVDSNYGPFIDLMSSKMKAKGKLLTAAYGTWFGDRIPSSALQKLDFVNVMSYDHCGSWTKPCAHAPYDQSIADLDYFAKDRGMPASKVVLGVPFYGWCWGTGCGPSASLTYPEIVARYPNAWQMDWIDTAGVQISYNGEATMQQKAKLSKSYGGLMIWEITEDALAPRSLLKVLTDAL